jgi:hypothetical protein
LDHTINAVTTEPPPEPLTTSTAMFYFDSASRNLRLTYTNSLRPPSTAKVTADFTTASDLTSLFADPILQTIPRPGFPVPSFPFLRGEWTSIIDRVA